MNDNNFFFSTVGEKLILSVIPDSLFFDYTGGTDTVNLYSNSYWEVSSKPSWVTVSPSTGFSNRILSISCSPTSSLRSGSITIISENLNINIHIYQDEVMVPIH